MAVFQKIREFFISPPEFESEIIIPAPMTTYAIRPRRTDKDFANFLNISLGSVSETKSHIYIALDLGYIDEIIFNDIYQKLDEVGKMVFALCSHLRKI